MSERLPKPVGGSSDVVHLLKYASLVLGWLPKVYRALEGKDTNVVSWPYEGVPPKMCFWVLLLLGALRIGGK